MKHILKYIENCVISQIKINSQRCAGEKRKSNNQKRSLQTDK